MTLPQYGQPIARLTEIPISGLVIAGQADGDLIVFDAATGQWTRLPVGAGAEVLTIVAGVPAWAAAAGGAVTSIHVLGASEKGVDIAITAGTHRNYIYSPADTWLITGCWISSGVAPTGAAIIVDFNKNGVTIFTTQANRPTIPIAGFTSGRVANMDVTTLADGDYLTVDIDQIGSVTAGQDLMAFIELRRS